MAAKSKAPVEIDLTTFEPRRLLGQDQSWQQIVDLFHNGTGPSGLILHGPSGIGKRTAAMVLAKTLLSGEMPKSGQAEIDAAHDRAARMVEQGAHPDLLFLEKLADKTELTVPVIRRIGAFFSTTGTFSQRRIVIIDGAEQLNREAANALLKRLEEPPTGGLVILIARSLGSLLPTVLSRCSKVAFKPLSPEAFNAWAEAAGQPELAGLGEVAGFAPGQALGLSDGKVLGWLDQLQALGEELQPQRHAAKAAKLASAIGKNGDQSFRAPFLRALHDRQQDATLPQARRGQGLYREAISAFARIDGLKLNAEDEWRALLARY
jgi:DNA polymerase-3 subunit delta'